MVAVARKRRCDHTAAGRKSRIAVLLLLTACVSGVALAASNKPPPTTLAALLRQPGENVEMALGTSDYQRGLVRLSFLVIRSNGQAIERPTARVWVATGAQEKPL